MAGPDLLPCPFCGGQASVWTTSAYSGDSAEHVIGCKACGVYTPFASVFSSKTPTEDDCSVWNSRAPRKCAPTPLAAALAVPEVRALVEAATMLKEIVEGIDGAMDHGTWRAERSNLRMKDTHEWVSLYLALAALKGGA